MTAKNVITLVVQYLGEYDLLSTTTLGGNTAPSSEQTAKLNKLFSCVNDTIQTLSTMYFPLKYKQSITSQTGIYQFNSLQKELLEIIKLTDMYNYDVKYEFFPAHFEAKNGTLNIEYTYLPDNATTFNQDLDIAKNFVTTRIVALGTISKYFMCLGMYNDANEWNKMFETACKVAKRRKDNVVIKKRRWL